MLNDYRKHYDETGESTYTPGVFSSGDEFETEDDVHNKYLGIIDALLKMVLIRSVLMKDYFLKQP